MRVRVVLAMGAVTGGFAVGAAPALARSNAASTQSYVQANYALVRVAHIGLFVLASRDDGQPTPDY